MNIEEIAKALKTKLNARVDISLPRLQSDAIKSFTVSGKGFVLIAAVYNSGLCYLIDPISNEIVKEIKL